MQNIPFFLLAALILGIIYTRPSNAASASVPITYVDSTPKKQMQYFYVIRIFPGELQKVMDTVNIVSGEIGRTMSVDESRLYQSAISRQMNKLYSRISVDSAQVK